jgi:transposase
MTQVGYSQLWVKPGLRARLRKVRCSARLRKFDQLQLRAIRRHSGMYSATPHMKSFGYSRNAGHPHQPLEVLWPALS